MKPGDLVRFLYSSDIREPKRDRMGIWLSRRLTRWSDDHPFHTIVTERGTEDFLLRDEELEVVSEAR